MTKESLLMAFALAVILVSCTDENDDVIHIDTPDWTDATHGDEVDPDYATVFTDYKVLRFDITIAQEDWNRMQADLKANIRTGNPPPPVPLGWQPIWVPCSFMFEGKEWYKAGIRYKGNSSLKECVRRNIKKYSFKLDFDEFEDMYPAIDDQRFYGFKQLNLANCFDDMSLMREKTASDLFRAFGIASARTSFCEVWIDFGSGPFYFGLYNLIEEVDDTVIETQFNGGGNLYKPEGQAATFSEGSFNTFQLYKKTNTENGDYSDVRQLYEAINGTTRLLDNQAWKEGITNIFDIEKYLKWLAANTVMQNWDTYGKMSHNYYLYNDPLTGRLCWIPWDNNESLREGKNGGALSLGFTEVTGKWPLIRYIYDDSEWRQLYNNGIELFIQEAFSVSRFDMIIDSQAELIRQYAVAEKPGYTFLPSASAFGSATDDLKQHVRERHIAAAEYLTKQQ